MNITEFRSIQSHQLEAIGENTGSIKLTDGSNTYSAVWFASNPHDIWLHRLTSKGERGKIAKNGIPALQWIYLGSAKWSPSGLEILAPLAVVLP